jgi:hypothetical protein
MVCVCGAKLPIDSRYSICESCMRDPDDPDQWLPPYNDGDDDDEGDENPFDEGDGREDEHLDSQWEAESDLDM